MRYPKQIEKEINLLAALIYGKLDVDGHWRMKMFQKDDLLETFGVKNTVFYRQLGYLKDKGYIEYVSPKENRAGKIKTLQSLPLDGKINSEALAEMDKFKATKLKIVSAMIELETFTTNDVKYYLDDTPRATIARHLKDFERDGKVIGLFETYKGSNKENTWRYVG